MAFVKGKVANPQGAGAKKNHQKRLIRELMSDHVSAAVKEIVAQLKADEPKDRQWAAEMVINYAYGKPSQAVELTGEEGGPLNIMINLIKDKQ